MILDVIATALLSLSILYGLFSIVTTFDYYDDDGTDEYKKDKIIIIIFLASVILVNAIGIIAIWL